MHLVPRLHLRRCRRCCCCNPFAAHLFSVRSHLSPLPPSEPTAKTIPVHFTRTSICLRLSFPHTRTAHRYTPINRLNFLSLRPHTIARTYIYIYIHTNAPRAHIYHTHTTHISKRVCVCVCVCTFSSSSRRRYKLYNAAYGVYSYCYCCRCCKGRKCINIKRSYGEKLSINLNTHTRVFRGADLNYMSVSASSTQLVYMYM